MGQMRPLGNPYAGVVGNLSMGGYDPALYEQIAANNVAKTAAETAAATAAQNTQQESTGLAQGGMVHGGLMFGANPPGPDDGAVNLDMGEYVIKKSSVDKYGKGLLDMINEGKVPAKKMKSYTSLVRENALADLESARRAAIQQTGERATQARAFGGSRQGVAESLTNLGFAKQAGTLGTQLNEQAFNQAMAAQQADIARRSAADIANQQAGLQGAQLRGTSAAQLGNLAAQQQALRLGGAQAVMGAGGARQALDQQQMDAIRNIGLQRLGVVQSSLGAQPANLGQIATTPYTQNVGAGLLGGALAGSQLAGVAGLTGGTGAALGALASLI
jgi:hypothetical protein